MSSGGEGTGAILGGVAGSFGGGKGRKWRKLLGIGSKRSSGAERRAEAREAARAQEKRQAAIQLLAPPTYRAQLPPGWQGVAPSLPSVGRGVYALPPPATPPTVPPRAPPPRSWTELLLDYLGAAPDIALAILELLRGGRGAGGGGFAYPTPPSVLVYPPAEPPMAQYLGGVPSGPLNVVGGSVMPSIWSGLGTALGQLGLGALSAIGQPQAMPGGAPLMPGVPSVPTLGLGTGTMLPSVRRGPSVFVVNGRAARYLGTPLAWSGDLAAVKRLRRAHAKIGKILPHGRRSRFR